MSVTFRRMKDTDIEEIYSIEVSVYSSPWSKDLLRDCVLAGYDCRILEINKNKSPEIAGYIISRMNDKKCHILHLSIAKSFQSQGFGRKLLQHLFFSLPQFNKIHSIFLEVRASNFVAINLYTSLGFEPIDVKKDYYKEQDHVEDAILFQKSLT